MRECYVCGKSGNMGKHHIIYGHGKRRACETPESLIDICFTCHKLIHASNRYLDMALKLHLQETYFNMGYDEGEVCRLMGGKLLSNIWDDATKGH